MDDKLKVTKREEERGDPTEAQMDYKNYVIVIEPALSGTKSRVIATKNGLHCAEWIGNVKKCIAQAKEYIDDASE